MKELSKSVNSWWSYREKFNSTFFLRHSVYLLTTSSCHGHIDELATGPFLLLHREHGTGYRRSRNCCDRRTRFVVIWKHFCSFCLRAPGYGLTPWCALGLLVGGAIQVPQLQLTVWLTVECRWVDQLILMIRSPHLTTATLVRTPLMPVSLGQTSHTLVASPLQIHPAAQTLIATLLPVFSPSGRRSRHSGLTVFCLSLL